MKKWWMIPVLVLLLTGCGARETFENVTDVYTPVEPAVKEMVLALPEEAAASAMESGDGAALYDCGSYEIQVEICTGGDLDGTVRRLTGCDPRRITVIKSTQGDLKRYDFTWCAAGETGERVGRAAILDDGCSHYCVTVLGEEADAGTLQTSWNTLLQSFNVVSY